ncbi:MAG: hypothetical protein ABGY41_14835 [Candidatus Poribacteria bacterium]
MSAPLVLDGSQSVDTPREEEETQGDEELSEEEEFDALMAAASEQAAEGVVLPTEDDEADELAAIVAAGSVTDTDPDESQNAQDDEQPAPVASLDDLVDAADPAEGSPEQEASQPISAAEPETDDEPIVDAAEPTQDVTLEAPVTDVTQSAKTDDAPDVVADAGEAAVNVPAGQPDADAATDEEADAAAAVNDVDAAPDAPAQPEDALAAATTFPEKPEPSAPTIATPAARPTATPTGATPAGPSQRNNDIARLLALTLAMVGLCLTAWYFVKLRERALPPPNLVAMPTTPPLDMSVSAAELPTGVATVIQDGSDPAGDTQVAVAGDPPPSSEPAVEPVPVSEPDPGVEPPVVVEPDPEPPVVTQPDPEPEPAVIAEPDPEPPVVVIATPPEDSGPPEVVEAVPAPAREQTLSAREQLELQRRGTIQLPPEPLEAVSLSAEERRSLEAALSTADREFVRALIEDAAGLPARVGNAEWARLRQAPGYHRTLQMLYDHVLSTDDKVRLVGAQRGEGEVPLSTPDFVRALELPPIDLARVREELWNDKSEDITAIVRSSL